MGSGSTTKPKLAQLQTPVSSTFPSELSALSAKTPLTGFPDFVKQEDMKTPITPPSAYTDFLKSMASPATAPLERSPKTSPTSAPTSDSSDDTNCSCHCETRKSPTTASPPTPFIYPNTARSTSWLGRLRIPPSPAFSTAESPLSAPLSATSIVHSPYSARSARGARSPYDWSCQSKTRYIDLKPPKSAGSNVRHVREILTRTVTYTPRMSPAPKGKRRKIE
ncbi:hypothetical protein OIDMADRAFT_25407 [Oidiodendron maius Zn]|uniref:Uncharacterized protein n=1 Tax=Oidiodendron maius (strain Zn) TaxID=913774 RepID=A0A0C3HR87_OIDMZ|nr:hypothetical protein OIDMADRAFT_25407 [Oidiodendron maius Zn]